MSLRQSELRSLDYDKGDVAHSASTGGIGEVWGSVLAASLLDSHFWILASLPPHSPQLWPPTSEFVYFLNIRGKISVKEATRCVL